MRLKGKHHACPSDLPGPGHHVLKDRLMTEVHPVKVPEREDGLGIGSCIEGRQILDNLHRSSRCVSVWGAVRAVGRWGTITMPDAGRNRKARSGALLLKNALDIGRYSKYKTHPQGGRAASGVSPLQAQPGGMTPFDPRGESQR